jgi:hypothetical protein
MNSTIAQMIRIEQALYETMQMTLEPRNNGCLFAQTGFESQASRFLEIFFDQALEVEAVSRDHDVYSVTTELHRGKRLDVIKLSLATEKMPLEITLQEGLKASKEMIFGKVTTKRGVFTIGIRDVSLPARLLWEALSREELAIEITKALTDLGVLAKRAPKPLFEWLEDYELCVNVV